MSRRGCQQELWLSLMSPIGVAKFYKRFRQVRLPAGRHFCTAKSAQKRQGAVGTSAPFPSPPPLRGRGFLSHFLLVLIQRLASAACYGQRGEVNFKIIIALVAWLSASKGNYGAGGLILLGQQLLSSGNPSPTPSALRCLKKLSRYSLAQFFRPLRMLRLAASAAGGARLRIPLAATLYRLES